MTSVGIRALKQNASAVVARAASGETLTITDRGRSVAQLSSIPTSPLQRLVETGRARQARALITDLPGPEPGPALGRDLTTARGDERF